MNLMLFKKLGEPLAQFLGLITTQLIRNGEGLLGYVFK